MSSSLTDGGISEFIRTSLETLRDEFPTAYLLLCTQLTFRTVLLIVDREKVVLRFDPLGAHILSQLLNPVVQLYTTRQTILDVIDARLTLYEAVLTDAILLQGAVENLAAFHEGLLTYVQGAARCPSFPALLDRFRYTATMLLHGDDEANTRQ